MIIEQCKIIRNDEVAGGIWEMEFSAPGIVSYYTGPGQFLEILLENKWSFTVRRPMSIANVEEKRITIIYKIFGRGTKLLSESNIGGILDLLGPLGNVFSGWKEKYVPILVGGGVGLAPILNLFKECQKYKIHSNLILGARTGREHFIDHDPSNGIFLTTDDGTLGTSGTVIPTLENVFSVVDNPMVYACGPLPMLKAVQDFVIQNKIPAQLSVESYMGCGTGLCQGCVIKKRNIKAKAHSYHERYSLVCMDGPVYSADEVCFD